MKTIIAGSRSINDYAAVVDAVARCGWEVTEVVSGTASGVDRLGESYATINKLPCSKFPAQWQLLGKSAGYKRNEQMADYAEALIAIWDGESKGTKHMIDIATAKGLKVFISNNGTKSNSNR